MTPETLTKANAISSKIKQLEHQLTGLEDLLGMQNTPKHIEFTHSRGRVPVTLNESTVSAIMGTIIQRLRYDIAQLKHTLASL